MSGAESLFQLVAVEHDAVESDQPNTLLSVVFTLVEDIAMSRPPFETQWRSAACWGVADSALIGSLSEVDMTIMGRLGCSQSSEDVLRSAHSHG